MADAYAIGIDLGGTQVRAALVDRNGTVLKRAAVRTAATAGPDIVIGQMCEVAQFVAAEFDPARIVGAGVSAPGPLDTEKGIVDACPTLAGFENLPLRALLAERLGQRVIVENDGIAACFGEWRHGAGQGLSHLAYATISTGIGGGVVSDGRLLHGRRGMTAHIGHMMVIADGDRCSCGNRGCFEAYASGTAFARRAVLRVEQSPGSVLRQAATIDGRAVFMAAESGDELACELVAEEADLLGIGIVNLMHLYSPERIILGGGIANGFDLLRPGIAARVARSAMPAFRDIEVVRATLGENSGLIGAAALMFMDGRQA